MNVQRGVSTDFGRNKVSAMVEESDLLRMLAEAGADDPEKTSAAMISSDVLMAMDEELQSFTAYLALSWTPRGSVEEGELKAGIKLHRGRRDRVLAKYVPALAAALAEAEERRAAQQAAAAQ
jgi:predicted peroxiredoxin